MAHALVTLALGCYDTPITILALGWYGALLYNPNTWLLW